MNERIQGIYAIIDEDAAVGRDPAGLTAAVLGAGVKVVQYRAKHAPAGRMVETARTLAGLCREQGAVLIVNDRLDVALAAGADGVHLGQDDLPLEAARRVVGSGLIVGVSTHSVEEALAAEAGGADYIGFGAMYPTGTKRGVTRPQGPEGLKMVTRAVNIPVAAIGGIKVEHLPEVKAAGARAAAVISAICGAEAPEGAARMMVEAWREAKEED